MDRMLSSYVGLDFHGSVASWELGIAINVNEIIENMSIDHS